MAEPLFSLVNIAVLVFSVITMLSVGFSYTLREIVEPLRNARGVLLALTANFALVPLLAYGVTRLLSLDPPFAIVVALGTAQRNIAAATVVATQSFGDPRTLVMVIITSIVSMALLFPIARIMGKRTSSAVAVRSAAVLRKSPFV